MVGGDWPWLGVATVGVATVMVGHGKGWSR